MKLVPLNLKNPTGLELLGNKAKNLVLLSTNGISVPEGFGVGFDFYETVFDPFKKKILELLQTLPPGKAAQNIRALFESIPLPEALRKVNPSPGLSRQAACSNR